MRTIKAMIIAAALASTSTAALAADMPLKAPPYAAPFATPTSSGWYVGAGTEGGVASSSISGTTFPSLTGGNLTADGASVGIDTGYIWGNCLLQTWCQIEVDLKYQNIGGSMGSGSVNSRWSVSEEFDVGAQVFQTILAAVGDLGVNFPTFNPSGLLPANVAVATIPRQYFGFVADEYEIGGTFGSASGQTWGFAPGVTTGYRWQTLGTNGQPNDGSLKIYAKIEWPTKGVDLSGVFAGPGGAPLAVSANAEMSTLYLVGIHYDFGIAGR
jgi:hypothetical protein